MWVMSTMALMGNSVPICYNGWLLYSSTISARSHVLLVLQLAVADIMTGAYLLIIGTADMYYQVILL